MMFPMTQAIDKFKRVYPLACILLFVSSFLFLFRNQRFIADREFLFTILPQIAIVRHIGFFDNFWNSYSGCGVPFFPQPFSKPYLVLNIFFHLFDPRTAYILFLVSDFVMAYFAFYFTAKYFYGERYVPVFLSLLYVSSGTIYGFFTVNYIFIEYYLIIPIMVMILHKYIERRNSIYLILFALLSIYANLGFNIIAITMVYFLLNLFIIFFVYEKYKKLNKIIYYLFLINIVTISVNLFKIIPTAQYYLIEGARLPSSEIVMKSLLLLVGPLHFLFLSGTFPINLHYLSFFLLLAYLFYPKNAIERVSIKTLFSFILIIYISYITLFLSGQEFIKNLSLHRLLWFVHLPGILMLGTGVRAFIVDSDRKKEWKTLATFGILWFVIYFLYVIKKQSFDIRIMQNVKWPFLFGITFFLVMFISKNIQFRKISSIIIVLIYAMTFIHSNSSYWRNDNTYQETYSSNYNKEILETLGIKSAGNFTYNKIGDLYRIMYYNDKKLSILDHLDSDVPFFSVGNYPILFGVSTIHNHDNVFLKRYATFVEILETPKNIQQSPMNNNILFSPLFPLLNVKYLLTYDDIGVKSFSLHKELTDKNTKIYKNNNLLPRFFVVNNFIPYDSKEEFIKIVNEGNIDLTKTVLIEGYPGNENKNTPIINYKIINLRYKNNSVIIDLDVSGSSFLIALDNYYPGWRAYINGSQVPIYPAYLTFRAIHLPTAGSYKIEFKYRPTFFKEGIIIAAAVFMLLFLGLFYEKRKITIRRNHKL